VFLVFPDEHNITSKSKNKIKNIIIIEIEIIPPSPDVDPAYSNTSNNSNKNSNKPPTERPVRARWWFAGWDVPAPLRARGLRTRQRA
jgi:hypothetical protein